MIDSFIANAYFVQNFSLKYEDQQIGAFKHYQLKIHGSGKLP